ncbi:hypothetical protein Back2_28190 [Nocardioides baekrokdamisoli]|uniref:Uncharacterized protein n=1 Tax=Nocardioides baekrokdamisoli TaxID=1804624 RepID=A0A3G9IK37_9ACTN|nr:hypothetical protein [Nocardioides baekrokdamisoli]BBH18532.1 hypothetical protein Back2_28190 [Nocardioides baekrokdamisoli]
MRRVTPWGFIGIGGLACDLFLYGASATFAPLWVVALMVVIWLPLMGLGMKWFNDRALWTFWVSVVGAVLWLGEIALVAATK